MSIYARLLALSDRHVRTEDVLTEVVAHLLRRDADLRPIGEPLVVRWLRDLGVAQAVVSVEIDTQRAYPALATGEASNRPDLVIEIERADGSAEVVFVESKVDSGEGTDQLNRYARTLAASHASAATRLLVYLTRDPDPKEGEAVLAGAAAVQFRSSRWHHVYDVIHAAYDTAPPPLVSLYDDTLSFLRHLDMDHDARFTPADALALARIPRTLRFLDSTLWDGAPPLSDRFAALLGGVNQKNAGLSRIRDHDRYTLYRKYEGGADSARFEVLLGYTFGGDGFPRLQLELGSLLTDGGSEAVAQAIRALDGRAVTGQDWTWSAYRAPELSWGGAFVSVPVEPLLAGDDHADAFRNTLHALLDELERVMRQYPDALPWNALPEA